MGFFDDRLKQFRQKAPMMGTLGGPGYGEFPLGSAGPRVDPRDPNYRPPPRPGGGNPNPFNNPLFSDPGLGGEGGRGGDRQVTRSQIAGGGGHVRCVVDQIAEGGSQLADLIL